MKNQKRLVFATNNVHKLEEARRIIGDDFEIVSLAEIGCHDDIPETADTLEGNALIKARWVKDKYGYDCFSDDTGLMVDALDGAPGVYSARYAGESCTPTDNVAKLLEELKDEENRKARFSTVVALIADGEEHLFEGRVEGSIAREAHGEGGFGYDPVFVAEESGKCFAEMTAEDKNAISHRGRAMRRLRDFLGAVVTCLIMAIWAFAADAQQWRMHSAYDGQMERIIDTPKYVYFLGLSQKYEPYYRETSTHYGSLMRYDKDGDEFSDINEYSRSFVRAIEYNKKKKYLAVAYSDGDFDFMYDNGDVVNVPGLKMADASLSKDVNSIYIDEEAGLVYLATNFGFVTLDDNIHQIKTSRTFGVPVNAVAKFDGILWLAANDKIYHGDPNALHFEDFAEVADASRVYRMYPFDKQGLITIGGRINNLQCSIIEPKDGKFGKRIIQNGGCRGLEPMKDGFSLFCGNAIQTLLPDGTSGWIPMLDADFGSVGGSYDGKVYWLSTGRKGISEKRLPEKGGNWTVLKDNFFPNVSSAFMCPSMAYSPEYGVLVRNHSMDQNFNSDNVNYFQTQDLISAYKDMTWKRVAPAYLNDTKGLRLNDPKGIAIDPNNPDHVYGGSVENGLMRLDLKDINKSLRFGKMSDKAGGYGEQGFIVAVEESPDNAFWKERCTFSAPKFDSNGTLWTMYLNPVPDYAGSDHIELWYWTAQDRAATTNAKNFRPFKKIVLKDMEVSNNPVIFPLKVNKNIIVIAGNQKGEPIIVFDHNGTPENRSDDRIARLLTVYDQDGSNVPFDYGFSFHEDSNTGLVWVGTNKGVFTFDPKEIFSNQSQVRRIKVPRNDGTNLADYLLDGVLINQIAEDASGNKWFATRGAGLMCTSADGREVLYSYSPQNSPIPGDNVYSLCFNPDTNSIMMSTDGGLCELFLTGTVADTSRSVRIFPNPARPDYHGYVTIDGLDSEALVKIVDTTGGVIKNLGQAQLGSIEWDLTDYAHRRVPGGVYFVVATNSPDSDKYIKMGKLLVVE